MDSNTSPWLFEDPSARITAHRNLLVIGWFGDMRIEHSQAAERFARRLVGEYPGKTALLNVVMGGTPSFDDQLRREIARLARDPMLFRVGVAQLILSPGLMGTATRAFMSTVLLVAKPPYPARMLPSLDGAAAWLAPKLDAATPGWNKAEIIEVGRRVMTRG